MIKLQQKNLQISVLSGNHQACKIQKQNQIYRPLMLFFGWKEQQHLSIKRREQNLEQNNSMARAQNQLKQFRGGLKKSKKIVLQLH